jgi:hypothetical protein
MSSIKDGGAAFPYESFRAPPQSGMTLRDYFAAKALASLVRNDRQNYTKEGCMREACFAYQYADAMLAAREVQP